MPEKQVPRPWGGRGSLGLAHMHSALGRGGGGGAAWLVVPGPSHIQGRCWPRARPPRTLWGRMSSREGHSRSQNSMKFNFPPI